jgi:hypothetical protein
LEPTVSRVEEVDELAVEVRKDKRSGVKLLYMHGLLQLWPYSLTCCTWEANVEIEVKVSRPQAFMLRSRLMVKWSFIYLVSFVLKVGEA